MIFLLFDLISDSTPFSFFGTFVVAGIFFHISTFVLSFLVEGRRKAIDRSISYLIFTAFGLALIPLISLIWTVFNAGKIRFDITFFTQSMYNILGSDGGGIHAVVGTVLITSMAALISIPIGLLTAIYLVEYGKGKLARAVTFFVDVMIGIPSIVAGLFAYSLFLLFFGPTIRNGFMGSIALSILMIPVVVRSSEEMLRLVPDDLREASYALGAPKWLTILKVVLPTSLAGITTGVMLSIARVIGETAPLLIVAGFTTSMNYNLFNERMMTLPVFVYTQYTQALGSTAQYSIDRAWAGALTLIIIVMMLNLLARLVTRIFAPKYNR